jgi:signal transduction histidine kinase
MLRKLLDAPWPDEGDLPQAVKDRARVRIRQYWRGRIWPLILGEIVVWVAMEAQKVQHPHAYLVPVLLVSLIYGLGLLPGIDMLWLGSMAVLLIFHGMLINGIGGVTAVSFILPYTFAAMMLPKRKRLIIQALCVIGFWFSLFYEVSPLTPQLIPARYLRVSYNILLAAVTFQALRFLNRLAVELNTAHVAEEVTQRSQQFLARVSHELRTPLNSVLGFAKLLRLGELPATDRAEYVKQVVEEGEQLNHLVSDLLDGAQLSAGKLKIKPGECDVNAICSAVVAEIQPILKPGVTLTVELGTGIPPISADGLRLRQIIRNLVGNAAKYTARGEIVVQTLLRGSSILVAVKDTGPGIPEDQLALVFVPFVKLDGRSAGIGLGLDIARQLALLHGGDIRLESVVGQGSTFTLELPVQPSP